MVTIPLWILLAALLVAVIVSSYLADAIARKETRLNILAILAVGEVGLARRLLQELEKLEKDDLEPRKLAKFQYGTVKRFAANRLGPSWLRARHGKNIPSLKAQLTAFIDS